VAPTPRDGSPTHAVVVDRVVDALRRLPFVVAVGAYGSTASRTWTAHSDVDLLAVTDIDPPIESLRFFIDGVAVDLNFRSPDATPHGVGGADFVPDLTAVWDPRGILASARPTGRTHNPAATHVVRYMLFHDTQKLRQIEDPRLRRLAMGPVVDQVVRAWYQTRNEPFPGAVASVRDLQDRAATLVEMLDRAITMASTDDLVAAAELATAPAGGVFNAGDVLAVSWQRPAVESVPEILRGFVADVVEERDTRP
jgi:hypothetical protein